MARPGRPSGRGFTLVELLLVMFILSVILALVVGVSWYVIEEGRKKETIVRQKNLLAAIDAFRKVTGHVPGEGGLSTESIYFDPDNSVTYKYNASEIMARLINVLTTGSSSNTNPDITSSIYKATSPFLGQASGTMITDAYGNSMLYIRDGGVGGKPVIISAGPDGKFGYGGKTDGSTTNVAANKQQQKDNIRSDMN
jgi:prepilin-type N-terminal cleavage/methylation domain-containing protein